MRPAPDFPDDRSLFDARLFRAAGTFGYEEHREQRAWRKPVQAEAEENDPEI